jgi:hypothetical protein
VTEAQCAMALHRRTERPLLNRVHAIRLYPGDEDGQLRELRRSYAEHMRVTHRGPAGITRRACRLSTGDRLAA